MASKNDPQSEFLTAKLREVRDFWKLSSVEMSLLLLLPENRIQQWLSEGPTLSGDLEVREEVSAIQGLINVYSIITTVILDESEQRSWLKSPSGELDGKSPFQMMCLENSELRAVRRS